MRQASRKVGRLSHFCCKLDAWGLQTFALPSIPSLVKICDAFQITLSEFFAKAEGSESTPVVLTPQQMQVMEMLQDFKNVRLSEQICFQKQPFQRFRQVQAELCVVLLHQAINIIHLRAKRRTIRNYQNLLGFHWEDLLFDVIFARRRDTDNSVFLDFSPIFVNS